MKLESARELKQILLGPGGAVPAAAAVASFRRGAVSPGRALPVAVGIGGTRRSYRIAVRIHDPFPGLSPWLERVLAMTRNEVDIRVVGKILPQSAWSVARHRPLLPGSSIGHARVTAGTLGAFVEDARGGGRFVLSNNHVLADEDRASKGDPILQPARADGGRAGSDVVARLERTVRLRKSGNRVDAALARLEDGVEFDPTRLHGLGPLLEQRVLRLEPGDRVAKLGRTTGLTRGFVSAIEVDRLIVGYEQGEKRFDDQLEISPLGRAPFSQAGDSGAMIVDAGRHPAALLFAGNDADSTYAHPLASVLAALRVRLLGPAATTGPAVRTPAPAEARRQAHAVFAAHGRVVGVGMTSRGGRPALKVSFAVAPRARARMPKEVLGLPVVVSVVGEIRKQEA